MAFYGLIYVLFLVVFIGLDGLWLSQAVQWLYRPAMGDMLAENVRIVPAVIFYLMYPLGAALFAVLPALRSGSMQHAMVYGALFGLFAYATYDLTNYATLRNWTLGVTLADMVWGAFATGVASTIAFIVARAMAKHFDADF